jgi:uncharacterized protein (UPF0264 family)
MSPLLLVSVRNANEAAIAVENEVDIVDIKDPSRGALGRADQAAVDFIVKAVEQHSGEHLPPVTMALGELQDMGEHVAAIPAGVSAVKLGLAGCRDRARWRPDWASIKSRLDARADCTPDWVAVIYADDQLAHAPAPQEVIAAAIDFGCRGVLVDTFSKSTGRLWDFVDPAQLTDWARLIHEMGMFLAVGGSIGPGDLQRLVQIPLDVVAIRGSVCVGGRREAALDGRRIREFRQLMDLAWHQEQPTSSRRNLSSRIVSLSGMQARFVDCAPDST